MALTPQDFVVNIDEVLNEEALPQELQSSRTWQLDLTNGRIRGFIDDKEAIVQFMRKTLATARNKYLIYTDEFGSDLYYLIGQNVSQDVKEVEIPRIIREALLRDDRIESVPTITIDARPNGDTYVVVSVILLDGSFLEEEVLI